MMNIDIDGLVKINPLDTVEYHAAIFGMTGSGKTNFMKVFAQELTPDIRLTIVDPEGDYSDLRFSRKTIIVGKGFPNHHIDIELTPDNAAAAADVLCHYDIPIVILNLSGFEIDDQDAFVLAYVGQLWKNYRFEENLPPHRLFIDEVQLFAPQTEKTQSKYLLRDMARRARKRNLTLAIATQEPQAVYKPLLNAAHYRVFLQVAKGTAMDAIKRLLPDSVLNAPGKSVNVQDMIASMNKGDALFMTGNNAAKVHIRANVIPVAVQPSLDDTDWLDKLRSLINVNKRADDMKHAVKEEIEKDSCVEELEARIVFLEAENKRLQDLLSAAQPTSPVSEKGVRLGTSDGGEVVIPAQPAVPPEVILRDQKRQTEAEIAEQARQRRNYQNLMLTVKKQSLMDRKILSFLVDHAGTPFTTDDIAAKLGYALQVVRNVPPLALVKAKLATRTKSGHRVMYQSDLLDWARTEFSTIPSHKIQSDIAEMAVK